eukprot:scaffold2294_cov106-Cylindrotheca_fusiformis.AAC.21
MKNSLCTNAFQEWIMTTFGLLSAENFMTAYWIGLETNNNKNKHETHLFIRAERKEGRKEGRKKERNILKSQKLSSCNFLPLYTSNVEATYWQVDPSESLPPLACVPRTDVAALAVGNDRPLDSSNSYTLAIRAVGDLKPKPQGSKEEELPATTRGMFAILSK